MFMNNLSSKSEAGSHDKTDAFRAEKEIGNFEAEEGIFSLGIVLCWTSPRNTEGQVIKLMFLQTPY